MNNISRKPAIILLSLAILGVFVKLLSGTPLLHSNLVYSPGRREKAPGFRTPEDTVKSFYVLIDSGDYESAWEIILEPDWTDRQESVSYRDEVRANPGFFSGWTQKEVFIQRMKEELGMRGTGVTLNSIEAELKAPLDTGVFSEDFNLSGVEKAYLVEVTGNLLGACSVYRWEKELTVVQIGRKYRVLLSGTKNRDSLFYQSWFSNLEWMGHLRGEGS